MTPPAAEQEASSYCIMPTHSTRSSTRRPSSSVRQKLPVAAMSESSHADKRCSSAHFHSFPCRESGRSCKTAWRYRRHCWPQQPDGQNNTVYLLCLKGINCVKTNAVLNVWRPTQRSLTVRTTLPSACMTSSRWALGLSMVAPSFSKCSQWSLRVGTLSNK